MTYSLLTVHRVHEDGTIDGGWLSDHVGDLDSARRRADATEAENSHGVSVAVVRAVGRRGPAEVIHGQHRLA